MANEERKIVIVDNHNDWGESLADYLRLTSQDQILQALNLVIEVIDSTGLTEEQMLTEVLKHEPRLVITGVRNRDNTDEHDNSGITLACDVARQKIGAFVVSNSQYKEAVEQLRLVFFDQQADLTVLKRCIYNFLTFDSVGKSLMQDAD